MPQFTKKMQIGINKVRPRDLIYPGITLLFLIIIGIVFFLATTFLAKNINDAFSTDSENKMDSLNIADYTIVAKKLGFSAKPKEEALPAIATTTSATPAIIETPPISDKPNPIDKKLLTINILNSTPKNGSAGALASMLETAGFAKAVTGNEKTLHAITTIFIKDSKTEFIPLLLPEVRKVYTSAYATTTPEDALFDATIIIGSK